MELSQSIRNIIEIYGKSILLEDRFVYILQDLYPDRNNPDKFKIISICIKEGINKRIQKLKKKNVIDFVNDKSSFISKTYGYNRKEISIILISIYNGCQKDLSETFSVSDTNNSKAQPIKGKQNNIKEKNNSNKQNLHKKIDFVDIFNWILLAISYFWLSIPFLVTSKTSLFEEYHRDSIIWILRHEGGWMLLYIVVLAGLIYLIWHLKKNNKNRWFFLIFSLWGVCLTPLMYIPALKGDMWPFFNLFIIVILHIAIYSSVYSYLGLYHSPNLKNGGVVSGALVSIGLFIIIGIILCPESDITKELLIVLGHYSNYELPWGLTYLIMLFYGILCIVTGFFLSYENLCKWNIAKVNISFLMKTGREFVKWFVITVSSFLLLIVLIFQLPKLYLTHINNKIKEENEIIKTQNKDIEKFNNQRLSIKKNFSFDKINLDGNIGEVIKLYSDSISQIRDGVQNALKIEGSSGKSILYHYFTFCDTIIDINSNWDNEDVSIQILIRKGKVGGINVILSNYHHSADSLIKIYSRKYGKPNTQLRSIIAEQENLLESNYHEYNVIYDNDYYDDLLYDKQKMEEGKWIFKNGTIHIYNSEYGYGDSYIEYISADFIKQYTDHIEKLKKIEKEREIRLQDSIAKAVRLEKIKEQEIQKQREFKHKKSIENI